MSKYKKVLCAFVDVRSAEDGMAFASANFIPNVKQIHNELKENGCSAMFDENKHEMFVLNYALTKRNGQFAIDSYVQDEKQSRGGHRLYTTKC